MRNRAPTCQRDRRHQGVRKRGLAARIEQFDLDA